MRDELWKESIMETLEETKETLSETAIKNLIETININNENSWMMDGVVEGRDPKDDEIDELKKRHASEIKDLENQILTYRQSVAMRRHVPIEDVEIYEGDVIFGKALGR